MAMAATRPVLIEAGSRTAPDPASGPSTCSAASSWSSWPWITCGTSSGTPIFRYPPLPPLLLRLGWRSEAARDDPLGWLFGPAKRRRAETRQYAARAIARDSIVHSTSSFGGSAKTTTDLPDHVEPGGDPPHVRPPRRKAQK